MAAYYLVRHGETVWSREGRFSGHGDIPMTPLGLAQAERLGQRLSACSFNAIYCSDSNRARQTVKAITRCRDLEVTYTPSLRDRNWGLLEGLTRHEVEARYPGATKVLDTDPTYTPPRGEALFEVAARVEQFREQLLAHHEGQILVVTHLGPIRLLLCGFLGIPIEYRTRLQIDCASISIVEWDGQQALVTLVNDTCHL